MRLLHKINPLLSALWDRFDIRYALKHQLESGLKLHGEVTCEHFREGKLIHTQTGSNLFTTEGMARILNVCFRAQATDAAIYCGIYEDNIEPAVGDTAAAKLGAAGTYNECQDAEYDDPLTNRHVYTMASTTTAVATNTASKADFVMAKSLTVIGAFLCSAQAKDATTGTLFCAKKFAASRAVIADDELAVTYQITLS